MNPLVKVDGQAITVDEFIRTLKLSGQYDALIEQIVRDRLTVQAARKAGVQVSEQEIQGVKTAALLHDIGKLAVPEHILSKPGPLTQEEFQKIRIHPQVGAEIISAVPFPYPVAPLILSHHERWDGRGYPQGLRAEDIPLLVDHFLERLSAEGHPAPDCMRRLNRILGFGELRRGAAILHFPVQAVTLWGLSPVAFL